MSGYGQERKRLPRHYWPIIFASELIVMILAAAVGVALGLNPYVVALVGGGAFVLIEVWDLKRKGF